MNELDTRVALAGAGYSADQIEKMLGVQQNVQQPMQQPVQQPMQYVQQPVQQPMQYVQQPVQQPIQYMQQPVQQPIQYMQQPVQQQPVQQPVQGIPSLKTYDQTALNYTNMAQQPQLDWGRQFEQQLNNINESLQKSALLNAQQPQKETTETILANLINPKEDSTGSPKKKKA